MRGEGSRPAGCKRSAIVALACVLLASCSTSDPDAFFGFKPGTLAAQTDDFAAPTTNSAANQIVMDENDPALPETVAAAPTLRPGSEAETTEAAAAPAEAAPQTETAATTLAEEPEAPSPDSAPVGTASVEPAAEDQETQDADAAASQTAPAADEEPAVAANTVATKRRGFLSAFFGSPAKPRQAPKIISETAKPEPIVALASATPADKPILDTAEADDRVETVTASVSMDVLPGVRGKESLFEISSKSGLDDNSDIDVHEDDGGLYQVASAAGMARLAPNGLITQTDKVDVACLKPSLVRVLKSIEGHYGKRAVVTSGYRNPERNRRARGARNSLHMYCAAADVQVPGVSKWELAKFARSMPGRGGVGTYCHTNSVHIDVGPERDWNWRCRRRK